MAIKDLPATSRPIAPTSEKASESRGGARTTAGPQSFRMPRRGATLALLAAALVTLFLMLRFVVAHPQGTLDFVNAYTAGTIVREGSRAKLYSLPLQREIETQLAPDGQFLPFDHPPFEAWLYVPLASLSYSQAYLLWAGFNLLVLGVVFYFLPLTGFRLDADSRLVWLATCLPLAAGSLVLGQDSLLLAPIFLFAYLALKKRRDVTAGLVLGLGLYRFEILLPFIFIFLLRRRWKLLAGFSVTGALALVASAALVGWGGLAQYGKVLLEVGKATGSEANGINVAMIPSLRGALAAFTGGAIPPAWLFPLVLVGSLSLLAWAAWLFQDITEPEHPAFDLEFSFAAIAALLASYHLFVHELTPLIVVAFLVLGYESTAQPRAAWRDRSGTLLLLLSALVPIVGSILHFRSFSVLFPVLLGLMVWLAQELAAQRRPSASP